MLEEDASASIGIDVSRTKLQVTMLSAAMTCVGSHGLDLLIYGALLTLFIFDLPKGILGTVLERIGRAERQATDGEAGCRAVR